MNKRDISRKVLFENVLRLYNRIVSYVAREMPALAISSNRKLESWMKANAEAEPGGSFGADKLKNFGYDEKQFLCELESAFGPKLKEGYLGNVLVRLRGCEDLLGIDEQKYAAIKRELMNEWYRPCPEEKAERYRQDKGFVRSLARAGAPKYLLEKLEKQIDNGGISSFGVKEYQLLKNLAREVPKIENSLQKYVARGAVCYNGNLQQYVDSINILRAKALNSSLEAQL